MSETLAPPVPSKEFDPSEGNPYVSQAGALAQDKFIQEPAAPAVEPTLDEVGNQAQALSDAGAMDRMAHAVNQQDAKFAPLYKGAQLAKKTAAEIVVKTVATGAGLAIASQVAGQGIDGFLDNRDQLNEQWQQQNQQFEHDKKQDEFISGMDQGKVTINVENPDSKA